ncbi:MAG: nucleoid occlusion protein [Clostridia bacterium]|nr:nucleoid occlusion protein [Clostridia bacterium]
MNLLSKFKSIIPIVYEDEYKTEEKAQTVSQIPIHMIKPNPHQPRRRFDRTTITELADSIRKYGVIQPITVRKLNDSIYELIAGERRLRACSEAGLLKIPAIVVNMNDNDSAVVALIENIQRENLSFMEEAEAYRNLLTNHGFTQDELAKKLGKNQSSVANKVRLLKLPMVVREIIKDNLLTERHARALLRLENCDRQIKALETITDENLNVSQTEELIDKMLESKNCKKPGTYPIAEKNCIKDVRIFVNTVRHAVDIMKKHGVDAEATENEYDDYIEYIIHIPKEATSSKSAPKEFDFNMKQ